MTHNGWITPFSISFIFALESIYLALMMKELCWSPMATGEEVEAKS